MFGNDAPARGYADAAQVQNKKMLDAIQEILADCSEHAARANDALDRALGFPPPAGEAKLSSAPNGQLENIEANARGLRDFLEHISGRCNRIA